MSSCTCSEPVLQSSTMLGHNTSKILSRIPFVHHRSTFLEYSFALFVNPTRNLRNSVRFRCVFDQIAPKFVISSSLTSVVSSGNVIAAAAAAVSSSGSAHAAVTSALAHVAVTALAIASGACLSTKVDFLWPRGEEQPGVILMRLGGSSFFDMSSACIFFPVVNLKRKFYHLSWRSPLNLEEIYEEIPYRRRDCAMDEEGIPVFLGSLILDGVDVTGYPIFNDAKVYNFPLHHDLHIAICCH
ncbi:hypothetical protein HHK36_000859 [Tetracentron sinense]|uniref:Uncharacterized protein n=1 Tax=Tetracentron sinense TaxID=13715 RepID=A0A834ZUW1_TETSI|nr:hypothetical protein HHK36_000859 [Tetracentron sinense]